MPEPDNTMGPFWPSDWMTGWFGYKVSDLQGDARRGYLLVSFVAGRNVTEGTHGLVQGPKVKVALVDGKPYHPKATINDDGDWVMEFGTTDDPDVAPSDNWVKVEEVFDDDGGSIIYFKLTAEHTFNAPAWPTDDLSAVVAQPGVTLSYIWEVAHEADGVPAGASVGQWVFSADTEFLYRIGA